ncbi:BTB/POZ domain-containing protein 7 [Pararge aegeria]|uniref:BTB/POZ domain-containing protein 7 n=1 Tax=Pararge aegeria TaxID=116150 RepID=UPI0019CFD91C|nr:BTB/POZ domain-containing protein 7 [Pararge aegeria]
MSRLLCCLRARRCDMGAALSHPQEGDACDGVLASPPTMADVIRERKKKAGGAGLGTLRRRLAAAARRPRDARPDRGCEHARFIRAVVGPWRLAEVFLLCEELEAGAALRDLATQAELAREPAPALHADLAALYRDRWWCDVEVVGAGWSLPAHRVILAARCSYFRDLLQRYPNCVRVPLEGAGGSLSRVEADAVLLTLYAGSAAPRLATCDTCAGWERGRNADVDLDIISVENSTLRRGCSCGVATRVDAARLRRLGDALGFCVDALHRDMRYLLDSGELCDARLSWAEGAAASSYGFRSALELPCHRLLLAARSRFFRSVMSRRCGVAGTSAGAVCVDEKVLPRRFARALLHAAYTDQVDLSLISRSSSSPSSTTSAGSGGTLRGSVSRGSAAAMLDDAFQLYEIARFLEMPIVAQGCEDAAARALSADTLPRVLRWACAPHASAWLHRQAMRFLRDEFPAIMGSAAAARLPRASLAAALASPFLQASEAQALRGVLRWAERAVQPQPQPHATEPNVVWHTTQSARRAARARGRRAPADAALRETVAALVPLLRLEHLPPDCDVLQQSIRRGIITAPPHLDQGSSADAWLGRGAFRSPRCFLPYLDEIKALLEDQAVPEAEMARARRQRYAHRIPDTLYMVAAAKCAHAAPSDGDGEAVSTEGVRACVSARVLCALRARVAELRASPPAARALALHAADTRTVRRQIALRAVRERSLPDACAELLLAERDTPDDRDDEWDRRAGANSSARSDLDEDCCRSGSGSLRCASGSVSTHASLESARAGGRRELPQRPLDAPHRAGSFARAGRLSAAVPDVAMAPNANTHLLTARDYPQPPAAPHPQPRLPARVPELGAVLQLDLGDGATHTPRPGECYSVTSVTDRWYYPVTRYDSLTINNTVNTLGHSHIVGFCDSIGSRASRALGGRGREASQVMSCVRRADDDELRAAIELSVIRAYSSLQVARRGASHVADLLPPPDFAVHRSRATPSPSAPATSNNVTNVVTNAVPARRRERPQLAAATAERRAAPGASAAGAQARGAASRSPSPRRSPYPLYTLYAHRDYRSGSEPRSRAHSPAYA